MEGLFAKQLTGTVFVYLVLSGYALREGTHNVLEALGDSSASGSYDGSAATVTIGPKHASGPFFANGELKVWNDFVAKIDSFAAKPSMKMGGSANKLLFKYMSMPSKNKDLVRDHISWGLQEYVKGNGVAKEALAAKALGEGLSKWISNQKEKKNEAQREAYAGCKFQIDKLAQLSLKELTKKTLLGAVESAFHDQDQSDKTCLIVERVRDFAESRIGDQLLGLERDAEDDWRQERIDAEETAGNALMELSSDSLMKSEEEFVGWIVGGVCALIVFVFWCANYCHSVFGPSFLELEGDVAPQFNSTNSTAQ